VVCDATPSGLDPRGVTWFRRGDQGPRQLASNHRTGAFTCSRANRTRATGLAGSVAPLVRAGRFFCSLAVDELISWARRQAPEKKRPPIRSLVVGAHKQSRANARRHRPRTSAASSSACCDRSIDAGVRFKRKLPIISRAVACVM
jgi:hypothetical protein